MPKQFGSQIILPRDPTAALEAATKQYVDGLAGGAHADTDHDDRFSQLTHNHDGSYSTPAHTHPPGAWQTMTPLNSPWTNGAVGPRYRFENEGYTVRLSGAVSRPSGSVALIFTFGASYRPDRGHNFVVTATSAFGRLTVTTGGLLQLNAGTATGDVFLDGITFAIV